MKGDSSMKIKLRSALVLIFSSAVLVAQFPVHANEIPEVRTQWLQTCPNAPDALKPQGLGPAIAAIFAPIVVEAAVDAVGTAIKASADTNTVARTSVPSYSNLYKTDKVALTSIPRPCLIVAKGKFKSSQLGGKLENQVERKDMWLEIVFEKIKGQPYYQLRPVYLEVNEFEDSTFWTKERRVDVAINLQGASEDKSFASATISFPLLTKNALLKDGDPRLFNAKSEPFALPNFPDVDSAKIKYSPNARSITLAMHYLEEKGITEDYAYEEDTTSVFSNEATREAVVKYCRGLRRGESDSICSNAQLKTKEKINLQKALDREEKNPALIKSRIEWAKTWCRDYASGQGPSQCKGEDPNIESGFFSTKATITMIRDANKYGVALANVISKSAPKIGELSSQNLPDVRKKARDTEEEEVRKANQEIAKALAGERLAQAELDEVQSRSNATNIEKYTAQLNLLVAMTKTNDAYVAAGLSPIHAAL